MQAPTWGRSLQALGLESVARWAIAEAAPAITGLVIDKEERGWPAEGFFHIHGRPDNDFSFWIDQTRSAKSFNWSALTDSDTNLSINEQQDLQHEKLIEVTWSMGVVETLDLAGVTQEGIWIDTVEHWNAPGLPENARVHYQVFAQKSVAGDPASYTLEYKKDEQTDPLAAEYGRPGHSSISIDESGMVGAHWTDKLNSGFDGPADAVRIVPRGALINNLGSKSRSSERFAVDVLSKVSPEQIWLVVQKLQDGDLQIHPFGKSTDFDLIGDGDHRLPPKAVFGIALSLALGITVEPKHFSGGEGSPCFRILRDAGFRVVPKHEVVKVGIELEEGEWEEGKRVITSHITRERAAGLAKAKKAQFVRINGVLKCEHCKEIPAQKYGTELADSCIEVHHARTLVSDMPAEHKTRLEDLECLCANCHRLVHRKMREGLDS